METSRLTPLTTLQAIRDDFNAILHPSNLKNIPNNLMSDLYHALTFLALRIVECKSDAHAPRTKHIVYHK